MFFSNLIISACTKQEKIVLHKIRTDNRFKTQTNYMNNAFKQKNMQFNLE